MNPLCYKTGLPHDQCPCADCAHWRGLTNTALQHIARQQSRPKPPRSEGPKKDELVTDIEVGRYALRTFILRDGKLGSLYKSTTWDNGVAVAECHADSYTRPAKPHDAPDENCRCGLYGTLTLDQLLKEYRDRAVHCVAVFAAEGTTFIGTKGLRTAAARIVAYWVADVAEGIPDGPDADGMGPFWRQGDGYLDAPEKTKVEDLLPPVNPYLEVFQTQCPEATHFTDIHKMLAEYKFPVYTGEIPPPAPPERRRRPFIPTPTSTPLSANPTAPQLPKRAKWDHYADLMKAATPGGVAAVKAVLEIMNGS